MIIKNNNSIDKVLFALVFALSRVIKTKEDTHIDMFYAEYQFALNYINSIVK